MWASVGLSTVEPLNSGHNLSFVHPHSEVISYARVQLVCPLLGVCPLSECPLSEVSLYQ